VTAVDVISWWSAPGARPDEAPGAGRVPRAADLDRHAALSACVARGVRLSRVRPRAGRRPRGSRPRRRRSASRRVRSAVTVDCLSRKKDQVPC